MANKPTAAFGLVLIGGLVALIGSILAGISEALLAQENTPTACSGVTNFETATLKQLR